MDNPIGAALPVSHHPAIDCKRSSRMPTSVAAKIEAALPQGSPTNFIEAREQWERLARVTAIECFDEDGGLSRPNINAAIRFWEGIVPDCVGPDDPKGLQMLPSLRLLRQQTLAVLRALKMKGKESLQAVLMDAREGTYVGGHGRKILEFMGESYGRPMRPHVAILASLLTPHRQVSLPTCSLDSLINAETVNHPERLARIYLDLLRSHDGESVAFGAAEPRNQLEAQCVWGRTGKNSPPVITLNPTMRLAVVPGGSPTDRYSPNLKYIFGLGNPDFPFETRKKDWKAEGITYSLKGNRYRLHLPIRNLTDLFFADFMAGIYSNREQTQVFIDVRNRYFGVPGDDLDYSNSIQASIPFSVSAGTRNKRIHLGKVGFSAKDLRPLRRQAKRLLARGDGRLFATIFSQPYPGVARAANAQLTPIRGHLENIDLQAFSNLDLGKMRPGETQIIGDRNWTDLHGEACLLGLRKEKGGIYMFLTARKGKPDEFPTVGWLAFTDKL